MSTDASLSAFLYGGASHNSSRAEKKVSLYRREARCRLTFSIISIAVALLHDDLCGDGLARSKSVDLDEHARGVGSHTHALEVVIYG